MSVSGNGIRAASTLRVLRYLASHGPTTLADLADALDLPLRTAYRWIDTLDAAGVPIRQTHINRSPAGGSGGVPLRYHVEPLDLMRWIGAARQPVSDDRLADMRAARDSGRTLESIGDEYGISKQRVGQIIGATGRVRDAARAARDAARADRRAARKARNEQILLLVSNGLSDGEIARQLSCLRATVQQVRSRQGIPPNFRAKRS